MNRFSFSYMRHLLALLFVLAGMVTLSNEAHCLGMSVAADVAHASLENEHSHSQNEQQTDDKHLCHHEKNAGALSGWAFVHQSSGSLAKFFVTAMPAHGDVSFHLTEHAKFPLAPSGTPPPLARSTGHYADIFAATGRMLI